MLPVASELAVRQLGRAEKRRIFFRARRSRSSIAKPACSTARSVSRLG